MDSIFKLFKNLFSKQEINLGVFSFGYNGENRTW